jgi:hypothetical protein
MSKVSYIPKDYNTITPYLIIMVRCASDRILQESFRRDGSNSHEWSGRESWSRGTEDWNSHIMLAVMRIPRWARGTPVRRRLAKAR